MVEVADMMESGKVIIRKKDLDLTELDLLVVRKYYGNWQNLTDIAIYNLLLCEDDRLNALEIEPAQVGFIMFSRGGRVYRLA